MKLEARSALDFFNGGRLAYSMGDANELVPVLNKEDGTPFKTAVLIPNHQQR